MALCTGRLAVFPFQRYFQCIVIEASVAINPIVAFHTVAAEFGNMNRHETGLIAGMAIRADSVIEDIGTGWAGRLREGGMAIGANKCFFISGQLVGLQRES
jgi:hypothetical protein